MTRQPTTETLLNSEADDALGIDSKAMIRAMSAGLTAETRKAVTGCWMTHRHLKGLESPVPILSALTMWIRDWGLIEEDARAAVESMCGPEKMRGHRFSSDLVADLAEAAALLIRERRSEEARAKRLAELPVIAPTEQEKVAAILAEASAKFSVPKSKPLVTEPATP